MTAGFVQLVGIGLIAFVAVHFTFSVVVGEGSYDEEHTNEPPSYDLKEDKLGDFNNFIVEKSKVGGGGFIGNKGALVARFEYNANPSSHLSLICTALSYQLVIKPHLLRACARTWPLVKSMCSIAFKIITQSLKRHILLVWHHGNCSEREQDSTQNGTHSCMFV